MGGKKNKNYKHKNLRTFHDIKQRNEPKIETK